MSERLLVSNRAVNQAWSQSYWVGVDGGGTACKARIYNSEHKTLGQGRAGPANGFLAPESVRHSILEAVREAVISAGLTTDDFARLHVGMALAGADDQRVRQSLLRQHWPFASVKINSDAYGACLGAFEGENGAIQIVGTGSCGLLICNGKVSKVGGHEFPISDQGSGAELGLKAIRRTLLACDGVADSSELTDSIFQHFNHRIDAIVHWSKQARPADYGWFAREVFDCADNDDPIAVDIVAQGVEDVVAFIRTLQQRGAEQVALMGSVAERMKPRLLQRFGELIVEPRRDAMHGALLMARESAQKSD